MPGRRWAPYGLAAAEQEARLDAEHVRQALQYVQVDGAHAVVFHSAHRGAADSGAARQLRLGEPEGVPELPEAEVDGHGIRVRLHVHFASPKTRRSKIEFLHGHRQRAA